MAFGPQFPQELDEAGLGGLPFSWSGEGEIFGRENLTEDQSATLDAVIASHDPARVLPAAVIAERERRLGLGFDYDFGDERGIHHLSTTPDDMRKWMDEVTPLAQSLINIGQPAGEITISASRGIVVITAMEWQSILIAAAGHRQPLYAASFALQAMNPIPANYSDDAFWP